MSDTIVRSVRIENELYQDFDEKYGKEFLGKFVNEALRFALRGKEYFSCIFWQEYSNIYFKQ